LKGIDVRRTGTFQFIYLGRREGLKKKKDLDKIFLILNFFFN
jgi:hypothetical protein